MPIDPVLWKSRSLRDRIEQLREHIGGTYGQSTLRAAQADTESGLRMPLKVERPVESMPPQAKVAARLIQPCGRTASPFLPLVAWEEDDFVEQPVRVQHVRAPRLDSPNKMGAWEAQANGGCGVCRHHTVADRRKARDQHARALATVPSWQPLAVRAGNHRPVAFAQSIPRLRALFQRS